MSLLGQPIEESQSSSDSIPAFAERFRFIAPTLPRLEDVMRAYSGSYQSGMVTNARCVGMFEEQAAEYLGAKQCVAVSSCTSGLTLVMKALGLQGEVIVPSFTFFATAHAVRWNGLRPVFVDCSVRSWNVDPKHVEEQITRDTSAILAVHMYGNPCEIDELAAIAARRNLKLLFDAAHAFGSRYRGSSIGQFGDAEVFSLSPTKLLVAGEGGLIATNDALLARKLRVLRNYGDDGTYDPECLGANARMPEFNAALALAGLPQVSGKVERRNRIAQMYTARLEHLPGIRFQQTHPEDVHTFKDYSIHVTAEEFGLSRDDLGRELLAQNIETKRYFYPPLHKQRLYKHFLRCPLPATEYVSENILSLPIYESLPDSTIEGITNAIIQIHNAQKGRRKAIGGNGHHYANVSA